jgi:hypothetical protein
VSKCSQESSPIWFTDPRSLRLRLVLHQSPDAHIKPLCYDWEHLNTYIYTRCYLPQRRKWPDCLHRLGQKELRVLVAANDVVLASVPGALDPDYATWLFMAAEIEDDQVQQHLDPGTITLRSDDVLQTFSRAGVVRGPSPRTRRRQIATADANARRNARARERDAKRQRRGP